MTPADDRIAAALGTRHTIDVSGGRIPYYDNGSGQPVVFVHGFMLNPVTWRDVIPPVVRAGYRCLAPELPMGGHRIPAPRADLSTTGLADVLQEFLDRLDLEDVTVVANDTGGAITQVALSRGLPRVSRVVLATTDCYAHYPPPIFSWMPVSARLPGARAALRILVEAMRIRPLQRLPISFGRATKRPIPPDVMDYYLTPTRSSAAIRADLRRYLAHVRPDDTLAAAQSFPSVDIPVLIAWAIENTIIGPAAAERLAHDFPSSTLRWITDGYMFIQEDQPTVLANLILDFIAGATSGEEDPRSSAEGATEEGASTDA